MPRFADAAIVVTVLLLPACSERAAGPGPLPESVTRTSSPSPSEEPLAALSAPAPDSPSPPPSPAAESPQGSEFNGTIAAIDPSRLTHSWREGCPVGVGDLRLLAVDYWGFDGGVHTGELVLHRDQASRVMTAMRRIFDARFVIERMELVDVYGGDDDRSMVANNTSAFNCREVAGRPGVWSQHAYGRAIDINPVQNPYVSSSGEVSPPSGAPYVDRSKRLPGMIHSGDAAVRAFSSIGWGWGGAWSSSKDFQHFSSTGR